MGILLQAAPLTGDQELRKTPFVDLVGQVAVRAHHGRTTAPAKVFRPVEETGASQAGLQRAEQSIVVQPMSLFRTESLELRPQLRPRGGVEIAPGMVEQ